jgi:hypothetical protein
VKLEDLLFARPSAPCVLDCWLEASSSSCVERDDDDDHDDVTVMMTAKPSEVSRSGHITGMAVLVLGVSIEHYSRQ